MLKNDAVKFLNKVASTYNKLGDNRRAGSFARAAHSIQENIKTPEIENLNDLLKLPGVGASTVKELSEFNETGSSERLKGLEASLDNGEYQGTKEKLNSALDKINALKGSGK